MKLSNIGIDFGNTNSAVAYIGPPLSLFLKLTYKTAAFPLDFSENDGNVLVLTT